MARHPAVIVFATLFIASSVLARERGAYLGDLSWPEAEQRIRSAPLVILPFGAGAKEHGPHLPMNADQVVMDYLLQAAVDSRDVLVAPPVLHGWFPAFRDFPGTEIADPEVFRAYIQAIAESLARQGAQRILFLNTGISKATGLPIAIAAREIRVETGVPTLVVSWDDLETDEITALQAQEAGGHGDEIETSINLYLQPGLVDMEKAVVDYGERSKKDYGGYQPGRITRDEADPAYSTSGIFGDATLATPAKGQQALAVLTREWLRAIDGFSAVARSRQE
jgi:creatinine amidohydrolase